MPPKTAKPRSPKKPNNAGGPAATKNLEADLVKARFEEDSWQVCVSLVVGRSPEEEQELIQALTLAVQQPQRKLFTLLSWNSVRAKILELGKPKAKQTDDVGMFYQVAESAKVLLDAGEEIPCDLVAKILKSQLLQIKATDKQRREAEQLKTEEEQRKSNSGAKVSQKKGKDSSSVQEPPKEKTTKLKRRGDVDPPIFIDDEPECGPQHYVLLVGFYHLHLIWMLDGIGVHVANVIKLCSEQTQRQQEQHGCEDSEQSRRPSPVLDTDLTVQARRLELFWSGLRSVLDSGPPDSKLHDVVQLSYTIPDPDLMLPRPTHDPEAVLELGSQIFGGVASLIYDCLDWRRQHQHYCDNVRLIDVPTVLPLDSELAEVAPSVLPQTPRSKTKSVREQGLPDQETKLLSLSTDVDMCYYNTLLDLVPPEACSVPLILHCMLEQVVIYTEPSFPTVSHAAEVPRPVAGPWLDHQLVSYMLESLLPLIHTEEERRLMLNNILTTVRKDDDKRRLMEKFGGVETQKKSEQTRVIRHHDERTLRLRDIAGVPGFNPAEVELSMMRFSPVWELIQSVAKQRNSNSCWMQIKQQLQHYCTDDIVSWTDVERLFHQSIFEAMTLTTLDQQGVLLNASKPQGTLKSTQQQAHTIIPWDNPLSYAKKQLHNLCSKGLIFLTEDPNNVAFSRKINSQLDLSDIQSCRLRSLFDWQYAEHHDATVFQQVLQFASEEYCCLDTFRGSHNDVLYIFCHNPINSNRQCKELWEVTLHTDVKFRNYLEHVADTISNWTREEELKTEAVQLRNQTPTETLKEEEAIHCVEERDTQEPVIRKDSLKAWKTEQERLKEEEMAGKSKKGNTSKGKQRKEEARLGENKKSKAGSGDKKKRPDTAGSSTRTPTEAIITTAPPESENKELHFTEEPFSGFTGYRMEGRLIHVLGCVQHLFPSDGGHITVENVSFVEGSSLMKLAVKKDGHHFYTHINQVVTDTTQPPSQMQDKKITEPKQDRSVSGSAEKKRVKQGSLSAELDNKIHLSYSFYGPMGEHTANSQEVEDETLRPFPLEPIPLLSSTCHSKEENPESVASRRQTQSSQGCEDQPDLTSYPFNSFSVSVPNGLLLQFLREDAQKVPPKERGILVRQSFPLHGRGQVQHLKDTSLSKELSRIINSQGAVIRYMRDGSTEVLFADGSVSFSQDSGPVWVPVSEVQQENSQQEAKHARKGSTCVKKADAQKGWWQTTSPSGNRIYTIGTTHKHIPTTSLLTCKATDPITHQIMLSREDLVVSVQNPDGSRIVEHADGTRITSLFQDRPLNATAHSLLHAGKKPESITLKSTSQHASSRMCVTHCVHSIDENVHIQDESIMDVNGEPCAFHEETMTDDGKTSACESGKRGISSKEQVVLVEKEGYATVVMYPERQAAHVCLADGTVLTGNNLGEYEVFPSSIGLLRIQSDGTCMYSSDPLVTPTVKGCTSTNQPGLYTMSHTNTVACDVTDNTGNHFQVMEDGQISVLKIGSAPSMLKHDEDEAEHEEEDREMASLHIKHRYLCPRLFLVHEDGSGTEFLNSHTVEELLCQAYADPTIALLREPLPGKQDEFGITILKPSFQSVWSQWLLGKQNPDITPPNLKNRSWHDFPPVEKKTTGPPFGTDLGFGLTLRERATGSTAQHQPVRSCPKVLEMRELYQHPPFTIPLKNAVDSRLKEYIESLMEREQQSEEMKVKDPRTEEESTRAGELFSLITSFAEEDSASHPVDTRIPVNVDSLYAQGTGASTEQSDVSEDTNTEASDSVARLRKLNFCKRKELAWIERLAKHSKLFEPPLLLLLTESKKMSIDERQELSEEKTYREALRMKHTVPYFHPENISLYQSLLHDQTHDMQSFSMDLPLLPKSGSPEALITDAPEKNSPRPLNPTPSQSESHAAGTDGMPENRPTNPTPQTAGESSLRASSRQCKSVLVDVTGKPRRTKVRLPTSILGSKPCSIPNQHFLTVEEPVRRKCRTVSLSEPSAIVRGFQLLPSSVDFGTLQEGTASTVAVVMKNVGVDTCRFHVKQPPPATGLRVIYNPGPVAAGLHVELKVQLFAMCAAQAEVEPKHYISQDIIIRTETEILHLPVTAIVLSERLSDKEHNRTQKKRDSGGSFQPSSCSGNRTKMNPHSPVQSSGQRATY